MFSNLNSISDMGLTLSIPDDVSSSTSISTRTSAGWISRGATQSSKRQRTYTLRDWTTANTPQNAQYSPLPKYVPLYADQLIKQIKTKKLDLYETANNMIEYKLTQGDAPNTIISYRLKLLQYFRFTKLKPDEQEYNDTVKTIQKGNLQSDGELNEEIITNLLEHSTPKYRVIFYLLITGARPGEISTLRTQDIDFKSTPARVTFEPLATKTKISRTTFLSTEAVQRIKYYLKTRPPKHNGSFPDSHATLTQKPKYHQTNRYPQTQPT
jgi:integrase